MNSNGSAGCARFGILYDKVISGEMSLYPEWWKKNSPVIRSFQESPPALFLGWISITSERTEASFIPVLSTETRRTFTHDLANKKGRPDFDVGDQHHLRRFVCAMKRRYKMSHWKSTNRQIWSGAEKFSATNPYARPPNTLLIAIKSAPNFVRKFRYFGLCDDFGYSWPRSHYRPWYTVYR